jgi:hypothetical protein
MRVVYQDKKLYISFTDEEVDKIHNNKHSPIEVSIGYLKVLHQDVSQAVLQHWENVEVPREVNNLQKCTKK